MLKCRLSQVSMKMIVSRLGMDFLLTSTKFVSTADVFVVFIFNFTTSFFIEDLLSTAFAGFILSLFIVSATKRNRDIKILLCLSAPVRKILL